VYIWFGRKGGKKRGRKEGGGEEGERQREREREREKRMRKSGKFKIYRVAYQARDPGRADITARVQR
jgi:hypothetical protein